MKQLLILAILFITSLGVDIVEAEDTTYSTITVKKKKKKSSDSSSGWSSSNEKDDSNECMSSCMDSFFESLFKKTPEEEAEAEARREERREQRRKERAQRQLLAGESGSVSEDNPFFDTPLHLMTGITVGGGFFSGKIAQGVNVGLPLSLNLHPAQGIGFRLYTEYAFEGTKMNHDFERNIFVDGKPAGTQELITDDYQSFLMPIRADILLFPPLPKRSLFFATGFGTQFKYEKVRGTLKSPSGEEAFTTTFKDWNPTVHVGVGCFLDRVSFELGYDYTPLRDKGMEFVPSDNSTAHHAITYSVSIGIF